MPSERYVYSVLIVSSNDKVFESVASLLPKNEFAPIYRADTSGEAKRMLVTQVPDIIIINTPLRDEFGIELAVDFSDAVTGVMLMVKNEYYEQISYKAERSGILTVAKPVSRQSFFSALRLLAAMITKLKMFEKKNRTLQEKMQDIRTVNRAKWLLIENMNMNESDAHYYIEKQAMDTRLSRREIAENIIRTYDN